MPPRTGATHEAPIRTRGCQQNHKATKKSLLALHPQDFIPQPQQRLLNLFLGPCIEIINSPLTPIKHNIEINRHPIRDSELNRLSKLLTLILAIRDIEVIADHNSDIAARLIIRRDHIDNASRDSRRVIKRDIEPLRGVEVRFAELRFEEFDRFLLMRLVCVDADAQLFKLLFTFAADSAVHQCLSCQCQ
ncbi:hypothetical protein PSAB6_200021 [Paraburkholderia sabiae]|nr:hypothetical protein PSAB6_200021 [Paraburkholderia sabiae]